MQENINRLNRLIASVRIGTPFEIEDTFKVASEIIRQPDENHWDLVAWNFIGMSILHGLHTKGAEATIEDVVLCISDPAAFVAAAQNSPVEAVRKFSISHGRKSENERSAIAAAARRALAVYIEKGAYERPDVEPANRRQ
jgi:hypothetical protein